jgi:hypothetical protein
LNEAKAMTLLAENHQQEQYFFDARTITELSALLDGFANPCCLCAPMLGAELHRRGRGADSGGVVRVLDIDERFAHLPGFVRWDLRRPRYLAERFGVIFVDPPFFGLSLGRLRRAVRTLAGFDPGVRLAITYLHRRRDAILGAFAPFNLRPTGYFPRYASVQDSSRNRIELFANFELPFWLTGSGSACPGAKECTHAHD